MTDTALEQTGASDRAPAQIRRLLVVEDNPADVQLLQVNLRAAGLGDVELSTADTLGVARRLLVEIDADAILLDLTLPDATELEAVAALVASMPDAPIIVVTGSLDDSMVLAALGQGAQDYLRKGAIGPAVLRDTLERAVQRHRADRRRRSDLQQAAAVLDAIDVPTVALDGSGVIIAHNTAWLDAVTGTGVAPSAVGVGISYLDVCDQARGFESEGAGAAAAAIRAVLAGDQESAVVDYPCTRPDGQRWFTMRVAPLGASGGGAVVSHVDITNLKGVEAELRLSHTDLRSLVDPSGEIVLTLDAAGKVGSLSPGTELFLGHSSAAMRGTNAFARIHPVDLERTEAAFRAALQAPGQRIELASRVVDCHGRYRWVDLVVANLLDDPDVEAVLVSGRITAEQRRARIVDRLKDRLLDGLPASVIVVDDANVVVYWNKRAEKLYGWTAEEAVGRQVADLNVPPTDLEVADQILRGIATTGRWEGEYEAMRKDGTFIPIYVSVEQIIDATIGFKGLVGASLDLSDRRALEATLSHATAHDGLTGLANRTTFRQRIDDAITLRRSTVAVLDIDIDDFKLFNDSRGQTYGDALLREVARILDESFPGAVSVSRLSGDEFGLALHVSGPIDALRAADRVRASLHAPVVLGAGDVPVRVSVGVALAHSGATAESLLRDAAAARNRAKLTGDRVELFDESMVGRATEVLELEAGLSRALENGELFVGYEPVVRFADGVLVGAEALVRWNHPTRGLIGPDRFIGIAERTGMIDEIGAFVLREACAAAAGWQALHLGTPIRVAVNLSARQIMDRCTVRLVQSAIEDAGILPGQLVLEITETVLMADAEASSARLSALRALGVTLSVDDFGTGYSSLAYLKRFPIDTLKIDRSFTSGIGSVHEDTSIVSAIINLAGSLGLSVVAEGVETDQQILQLARLGCGYGQGHRWGATFDADGIAALARQRLVEEPPTKSYRMSGDEAVAALSTLEHEVRSPLHVILGYSDVLADVVHPAQLPFVESIRRSGERIATMLDTLDDLRAFELGTLRLEPEVLDLANLAREIVTDLSLLLQHTINVHADEPVLVRADRHRVQQVLTNLLRNSAKFSQSSEPIEVTVVGLRDFGAVTVCDRGPGIRPEDAGRVWRRFGRGDQRLPGSGIGLYVSRGIALTHGGDLTYRDREGGGAMFTLTLPAAEEGDGS